MQVHLKIQRFNPETDKEPWWSEHDIEAEPTDRVLDALNQVKWFQDGALTYRRSCAHGICGSDAMRINGRNRLACKVLIKDVGKKITVQPLMGLPIIKDLTVDMEGFFAKYRSVKPYLITDEPEPERERLQSVEDRARFDDTTKCILCAACTTAVPVVLGGEWRIHRPGGDCAVAPLHVRQPRSRRPRAHRHHERRDGGMALPHRVQLRGGLPARHRHHPGDCGSEAGGAARKD